MATPYEKHKETGHHTTRYSPNGIDIIEECEECGMRWLHHPGDKWPVTMAPAPKIQANPYFGGMNPIKP